MKLPTAIHC